MSDRPDWLPEPTPEPSISVGRRAKLAVASVVSLLLGIFGTMLLLIAVMQIVFHILVGRHPEETSPAVGLLIGSLLLAATYALRRYLHRERLELRKRGNLVAAPTEPN